MQSFTSKELVKEQFSWRYYYWYLTNEGIEYLREYLNLSADVVPNTLKKSTRPPTRPMADERGPAARAVTAVVAAMATAPSAPAVSAAAATRRAPAVTSSPSLLKAPLRFSVHSELHRL